MPHKNLELRRLTQLKYRESHKEECKRWGREWHERKTFAKLGITKRDYNTVLKYQNNNCAICYESFSQLVPQKDHDHATGKFRGLLCTTCNTKLGWYEKFKGRADWYLSVPPAISAL